MKLAYRPDIDGLRGFIGIIGLIFHFKVKMSPGYLFAGGFLAVDVFFIISGFLITSILLRHEIPLTQFYYKRVRRLIPALVFACSSCLLMGWFYLPPVEYVLLTKSALAALFMSSNIYFYLIDMKYFLSQYYSNMLITSWSLGVEEQFYLVFPIVMILLKQRTQRVKLTVFAALSILSFASYAYYLPRDFTWAYYMFHNRIWQILFGAMTAIYVSSQRQFIVMAAIKKYLALPIIFALLLVFYVVDKNSATIPLMALFVACCSVILLFPLPEKTLADYVLRCKLLMYVGKISYSLYLWHLMVWSFHNIATFKIEHICTLQCRVFEFFLVFIFAVFSYHFVEVPLRNEKRVSLRTFSWIVAPTFLVMALAGYQIIENKGYDSRIEKYNKYYAAGDQQNKKLQFATWNHFYEPPIFASNDKVKVLFIGDSRSKDVFNMFYLNKDLYADFEFSRVGNYNKKSWYYIGDPHQELIANSNFAKADVIAIAFEFFGRQKAALEELIQFVQGQGKRVILFSRTNKYRALFYPKQTIYDFYVRDLYREHKGPEAIDPRTLEKRYYLYRTFGKNERLNNRLQGIAKKYKIPFFSLQDLLCNEEEQTCDALDENGRKLFFDDAHFTLSGAKHFGRKIHQAQWLQETDYR